MSESQDERLLSFLEGELNEEAREALLDEVLADPEMARDLRRAAAGLGAMQDVHSSPGTSDQTAAPPIRSSSRRISPWWAAAAAAAAVLVSVPVTWGLATGAGGVQPAPTATGAPASLDRPTAPEPSFLLVLQGRWPDLGQVPPEEAQRRGQEYWAWTASLSERGILMAAGDLRWEPGRRITSDGTALQLAGSALDQEEYVVGMFAIRVSSYEEAMAIARDCPHLEYGGTVAVRQVGTGFVTAAGFGDWDAAGAGF